MRLALSSKLLFATGAIVGLLAYLVVVDLGVNAGQVHYGVNLNGQVDLGGLTESEAFEVLADLKEELRGAPIVFSIEGLTLSTCPRGCPPNGLGWRADVEATTDAAMAAGRVGGPYAALADRVQAWLGGYRIQWFGETNPRRVVRLIDDWERRAAALGMTVDRAKLRFKLKNALQRLPRHKIYDLPLLDSA